MTPTPKAVPADVSDGTGDPQSTAGYHSKGQGHDRETSGPRTVIFRGQQATYGGISRHRTGPYRDSQCAPREGGQQYRKTIYHDGGRIRIEEAYRYSPRFNDESGRSLGQEVGRLRVGNGSSWSAAPFSGVERKAYGKAAWSGGRVTADAPDHRARTRPVVIHAMPPADNHKSKSDPFEPGNRPLTPPLTPRLGRLPTPDLPDIDENARFCDCCPSDDVTHICKSSV